MPKRGQAYFNGAGRCSSCHSPAGDLKGVGAKYEPVALQGRLLLPRGRGAHRGRRRCRCMRDPTLDSRDGDAAVGRIGDRRPRPAHRFRSDAVRRRDRARCGRGCATATCRKSVVTDPLQAHVDQLTKWTDADMHNMTAYLASLK